MAMMEVLLREDVENLGTRGELVRVRAGYGRNYLLPQGLAVLATASNVKQIEMQRRALLKRAAVEHDQAAGQAELLKGVVLEFARKVGEHGILFGSVTSMDIAEGLAAKGFEIERRRIQLKDPIKEPGDHDVPVKLHRDVTAQLKVIVRDEAKAEAKTEAKAEAVPETAPEAAPEATPEAEVEA